MKAAGFLLMLAGWLLVISAIVLLGAHVSRAVFVMAGMGVLVTGLVIVFRCHLLRREE